jgi:hypothetical protein
MRSLNCGVDVLCRQAVEPDSTGQHAQTYNTEAACIAARDSLIAKAERDTTRPFTLALRGVAEDSALPYMPRESKCLSWALPTWAAWNKPQSTRDHTP